MERLHPRRAPTLVARYRIEILSAVFIEFEPSMLAYPHQQLCRLFLAEALTNIASGACRLASLVTQGNAPLAVAEVDGDKPESIVPDGHRHFLFADRLIRVQGARITGIGASFGFAALSRPLKKCFSNASGTLSAKTRAAQTRLRSDCNGPSGRFAGPPAHFGRTYPWAHA